MNKRPVFLIMMLLVFSCKPGIPNDVLKPQQMENILFDIHIVDGYLYTLPVNDSLKIIASAYYNGVYKKYGIDSATFTGSKNYYYQHTDLFKDMYANIVEKLEKEREKQTKLNNDLIAKSALSDSMERAKKNDLTEKKVDSITYKKKINLFLRNRKIVDRKKQ